MNRKPQVGSLWTFDELPGYDSGSYHYLLLEEIKTVYEAEEWAFRTLTVETGKIETAYFDKRSLTYGGWKEHK